MKFAILRKADESTEAGEPPSDELLSAMGLYNRELMDTGAFLDGQGLRPSRDGARVKFSGGVPAVTDGPFAETRELIAGFTIIEADSKKEALEWVRKWPSMDADGEVELEVRRVFELEDFEPGEGIEIHSDLTERKARQPQGVANYLHFNGDCRKAFEFYEDCLGGRIETMMTYGDSPMAGQVPGEWNDRILHASLRVGKWQLMGSDVPEDYYEPPQGFSVQIVIDDPARAEEAFTRLSEGGSVCMAFEKTFWAYRFGKVADRFGVPWIINCQLQDLS